MPTPPSPVRTSVGTCPHVPVGVARPIGVGAADDVYGAGGVDHAGVHSSARPRRAGRAGCPRGATLIACKRACACASIEDIEDYRRYVTSVYARFPTETHARTQQTDRRRNKDMRKHTRARARAHTHTGTYVHVRAHTHIHTNTQTPTQEAMHGWVCGAKQQISECGMSTVRHERLSCANNVVASGRYRRRSALESATGSATGSASESATDSALHEHIHSRDTQTAYMCTCMRTCMYVQTEGI